tara:strand:+ start:4225 stop:4485 length:261 start_codon:yes stop_codon:yes gene_type:complete
MTTNQEREQQLSAWVISLNANDGYNKLLIPEIEKMDERVTLRILESEKPEDIENREKDRHYLKALKDVLKIIPDIEKQSNKILAKR